MPSNAPGQPAYPAQQKNQRRTTRAPLIVEQIPCGDGRKTFFGYAKNLSRGGLFIATVKPREPGNAFTLELTLPRLQHRICCRCEVVWKQHFSKGSGREPGMGLRFLDLTDADGEIIEAWVRERSARPQ